MDEETREQREYDAKVRKYETVTDERKLELNLFWQRSVFFWGFIASAFIAYAALKDDVLLRFFVSCFGVVCSLAWTLANRGSKYWYEAWEKKLRSAYVGVLDENIYEKVMPTNHPTRAWSGRRYSVTRLAIGLSDFTFFIWVMLFFTTATRQIWTPTNWVVLASLFATVIYVVALFRGGRSPG